VRLSVVIPALDEEAEIEAAVESARAPEVEVLVVDGGSRDATASLARRAGARVLASPRGRARQLALGFDASEGDGVLFLHADTRLPPGWADAVRAALADARVAGGAFRLCFDERGFALRVVEWGARLRAALFAMPYGDQALFARRSVLRDAGGIPQVPVMEDLDLVRAIRRRGRLALLPLPARTSGRRYRAQGVWRTAWRHALAAAAWSLGFDRARLAAWLRR
jgi:rSAM/selenodomain-associated transferase 2